MPALPYSYRKATNPLVLFSSRELEEVYLTGKTPLRAESQMVMYRRVIFAPIIGILRMYYISMKLFNTMVKHATCVEDNESVNQGF